MNKSRLLKLLHNLIWLHFLNVYVPSTPAVNTEEQGLTKKRFVINLLEDFYNNGNVAQQKSELRHLRSKKEWRRKIVLNKVDKKEYSFIMREYL